MSEETMDRGATPSGAHAFKVSELIGGEPAQRKKLLEEDASKAQTMVPIKQICLHLCAFHPYSHDMSRQASIRVRSYVD